MPPNKRLIVRILARVPNTVLCCLCAAALLPLVAPVEAAPAGQIHLVAISPLNDGSQFPGRIRVQVAYHCAPTGPAQVDVVIDSATGTDRSSAIPECDDRDHALRTDPLGVDLAARQTIHLTALLTTAGTPMAQDDRAVMLPDAPP